MKLSIQFTNIDWHDWCPVNLQRRIYTINVLERMLPNGKKFVQMDFKVMAEQ